MLSLNPVQCEALIVETVIADDRNVSSAGVFVNEKTESTEAILRRDNDDIGGIGEIVGAIEIDQATLKEAATGEKDHNRTLAMLSTKGGL
jgi:hypothetical protein